MDKNFKPFKTKCPNCGKTVYVMSPNQSAFCSKACEVNYKYSHRFIGKRMFAPTPLK